MTDNAPDRSLLCEPAEAPGMAAEYWGYDGNFKAVPDDTLIKVFATLGVDVRNTGLAWRTLADIRLWPWREVVPACSAVRVGVEGKVAVHMPHGESATAEAELENGRTRALTQAEDLIEPREMDGTLVGQASFVVSPGLPLGYHILRARVGDTDSVGSLHSAPLVVAPQRLNSPAGRGMTGWGVMTQLYLVCSRNSWGIGDTVDPKEMCSLFDDLGGDFVLINPLHSAEPVGRMTSSPYPPVIRCFFNPIYIRPEDIHEVGYTPGVRRALVEFAGKKVEESFTKDEAIDRDASWMAKFQILGVIYSFGWSEACQCVFERSRAAEGQGLGDFASWCVLREKYGEAFSEEFAHPDTP